MAVPAVIKILSDGNELSFVETIKVKDVLLHKYVYTVSKYKKGIVLELTDEQLSKLLKINS